ncbi:MAG: ACT domain-containing protein [Spirochaetales bacterium]|nr:ACT domain-containing protein [Spirochaetales bacterium]
MKIRQISVFLENTTGRLAEVTRLLADGGINIRAISIADTADFGILRMIVDKPDEALALFEKNDHTAKETDVLGVEVRDVPGGLAQVMEIFHQEKHSIEYLYASLERSDDKAVIIFKTGDVDRGVSILEKHRINSNFRL